MTRRTPLYFIITLLSTLFAVGCNEKANDLIETVERYSNTSVSSFSLQKDDSVVAHLDSVFFSIDLVGARIFNADSLPAGTDISRLRVKVGTSSAKACELTFRVPETTRDTTINIIETPDDSINFADGPVKMVVTSFDGTAQRTYEVKVNVHKAIPDTLIWKQLSATGLPSMHSAPVRQKTVLFHNEAYCFTSDGSSHSVAHTAVPFNNIWTTSTVALPENADINSIESTSDALYILDADGNLYTSADASTWTSTGVRMDYLYGGYNAVLLGARKDSDGWKHITYPSSTEKPVPAACPVGASSQLITYETKWSDSPSAIMLGGRKADGALTGDAWIFDGENWTKLSTKGIPIPTQGIALFPYSTIRTNESNWSVSERSALIAFGGLTSSGETTKKAYVSYDLGITWTEADSYLQLPESMASFHDAQALIFDTTLPPSRYIKPVEEWECPYIYLFGGYSASGSLINEIYRGAINRFTFKPII